MSNQYPGGLITKTPVTPAGPSATGAASGVWTLEQAAYWQKQGLWPSPDVSDPYFYDVTLLLSGDGTNGGQNNTFLDSSTNNFTITRNGNTTQGSFSPYGSLWSNYFNGSSDYLNAPSNAAFAFGTGDFTIEGWYFVSSSKDQALFDNRTSASSSAGVGCRLITGTNTLRVILNNTALFTTSQAVVLNQWNHIAIVRSSGTITAYLNGSAMTGGSASGATNITDTYMWIGELIDGGFKYNGYISNFRVVKGTAVYTSNFTPSTTPLTAITNTSLLTCQSNRFIDNSANNFALTVTGTPSVQRFSPFNPTSAYSTSVIGGSGYFDGTGVGYLTFAKSSAFAYGTGSFTIEFWFYSDSSGNDKMIMDFRDYGSAGPQLITTGGYGGTLLGSLRYVGSSTITSSNIITDNEWHHCAIVRNGSSNVTLYVDGISKGTGTDTTNYTWTSGTNYIAKNSYGSGGEPKCYMSDLRIVKGTAVYTTAFTPPTAPLTAITNTSLLLNMTNGAIYDSAMMNDLETVGNAQISTSVKKYGTGSMYFDGTGDYLKFIPGANCAFGTGDFTVEGWFYVTNNLNDIYFFDTRNASQTSNCWGCGYGQGGTSGRLAFYIGTGFVQTSGSVGSLNTWMHIAFVRANGTLTIYLNGSSVASGSLTDNASTVSTLGYIGIRYTETFPFAGYIDDLRITKGYARYTSNFTPPTAALPNF